MIWKPPIVPANTFLEIMSSSLADFTFKYKERLPEINKAKNIFCFSDYSGEETEANHSVYSFLIIDADNLKEWDFRRAELRKELLSDGRRISYKNYRDKLSERFIAKYLEIANELDGYLITVSMAKDLGSVFESGSVFDKTNPDFVKYSSWPSDTIEKSFRIMHLLSLFSAGFSKEHQNLIWITDNDKIAPNNERISQLTNLFAIVMSNYLAHNMGHLRVGTTNTDDGTRLIEDLCALPDLAAGSYSDQLKITEKEFKEEMRDVFWMFSPKYRDKTKDLTSWLTTYNKKLSKLYFKITKSKDHKYTASFYHFFDRD